MAKEQTRWRIEVTEEDIERAHRNDSYKCVVAQAVARTIPDATRIEVDTQAIRFTRGDKRLVYLTPYAVQGYVVAFDAGDAIQPFSFQIDRPQVTAGRRRTEAGRAVDRTRDKARRDVLAKAKKAGQVDPVTGEVPKAVRDKANKAARDAYAATAAATGSVKLDEPQPGRRPAPRVFRKRGRAYGHRLLRINQD